MANRTDPPSRAGRPRTARANRKPVIYPWGRATPSVRLERLERKVRKKIERARRPGFHQIETRVLEVTESAATWAKDLRHLAEHGLGRRKTSGMIPGERLEEAAVGLILAIGELADASIRNSSDRYDRLLEAIEHLSEVARSALAHGVRRTDSPEGNGSERDPPA